MHTGRGGGGCSSRRLRRWSNVHVGVVTEVTAADVVASLVVDVAGALRQSVVVVTSACHQIYSTGTCSCS